MKAFCIGIDKFIDSMLVIVHPFWHSLHVCTRYHHRRNYSCFPTSCRIQHRDRRYGGSSRYSLAVVCADIRRSQGHTLSRSSSIRLFISFSEKKTGASSPEVLYLASTGDRNLDSRQSNDDAVVYRLSGISRLSSKSFNT
jgi:hypothetical protein